MSKNKYIEILKAGKEEWNNWRSLNPQERADFLNSVLDGSDLEGYNLTNCNFYQASLRDSNFNRTELAWSAFFHTKLNNSTITNPEIEDYSEWTSFSGVNFRWSSFAESDLENVKMKGSLFEGARFQNCNLKGADISYSRIHGLSAWGNYVDESTTQNDLIITPYGEPTIKVDNFEIAQFLYLLITNNKIRNVIDTLATKVVLILGSFAGNDKLLLEQIKKCLTQSNYVPVIFDFEKPSSRNLTETVSTIAHISKFIIVDLKNSRSVPHELASIVPTLRSVPIVPIISDSQTPYGMFQDLSNYKHMCALIIYNGDESISSLVDNIIFNADKKIKELK